MKLKLILLLLSVLTNFSLQSDKCPHGCPFGEICGDWCECHWPHCDEKRFASFEPLVPQIPKILKGELHVEINGRLEIITIQPSTSFKNVVAQVGNLAFNFSLEPIAKTETELLNDKLWK